MDDHEESVSRLTDASLEREIEQALAVDPSAEFLARVRAQLVSEPAPARWFLRPMFLAAASAGIAVAVGLILALQPSGSRDGLRTAGLSARPILPALVLVPEERSSGFLEIEPESTRLAASDRVRRRMTEPEVLVASDESATLRHLMQMVRRGTVDGSTLDGSSGIQAIQPMTGLVVQPLASIPPIAIEPLQSGASEEGVRK